VVTRTAIAITLISGLAIGCVMIGRGLAVAARRVLRPGGTSGVGTSGAWMISGRLRPCGRSPTGSSPFGGR
jgi:hypothetical protein